MASDKEKVINQLVAKIVASKKRNLIKTKALDIAKALIKSLNKRWTTEYATLFETTWKKKIPIVIKPVLKLKSKPKRGGGHIDLGIEEGFKPHARVKKLKSIPIKLESAKPVMQKKVTVKTDHQHQLEDRSLLKDKKVKIIQDKPKPKHNFGPDLPDEFEHEYHKYGLPLEELKGKMVNGKEKEYICRGYNPDGTDCNRKFKISSKHTNRLLCPRCSERAKDFETKDQYVMAKTL